MAIKGMGLIHIYENVSFVAVDSLENREPGYWTADVAGLINWTVDVAGLPKGSSNQLREADAAPLNPIVPKPVPWNGYYFVALKRENSCAPSADYQQERDKSGRKVYNLTRYGFCAYPAEYNWRHRRTFITNEDFLVFSVDNGGKPVTDWPSDAELAERFTEVR